MTGTVFDTIAIIGAGLIGSSIARAAIAKGASANISIFDASDDVRAACKSLELGQIASSAQDAVRDADCVILCVPMGAMGSAMQSIAPSMKAGAIVTDVGSTKATAIEALKTHCPDDVHLIPGHPIAGTEQSGPAAGFATLFEDAWHILTPLETPSEDYKSATAQLIDFWSRIGAKVEIMDAARHDRVLAITSHLPHLIAYNIVATAYDMETVEEGEVVKYSAGGFRDFTRIAASDPTMWRDVFLTNKDAVLETLGRFTEDLAALQRAIRWGDGETLMREFTRARGIRKAIIDAGQDIDIADFGRRGSDQD